MSSNNCLATYTQMLFGFGNVFLTQVQGRTDCMTSPKEVCGIESAGMHSKNKTFF